MFELRRLGAHVLHRRLGVVDRARIGLHAGLHQPVFDGEHRVAVLGEIRPPVRVELAAADLPAAAMDRDQHRRLVEALRRVEIAQQFGAVVLGEHDVILCSDLVGRGLRGGGRNQQAGRHDAHPKIPCSWRFLPRHRSFHNHTQLEQPARTGETDLFSLRSDKLGRSAIAPSFRDSMNDLFEKGRRAGPRAASAKDAMDRRVLSDPRRPRAQPQEHRRRVPARPARGVHRPVRFRQILARLRHHLRRGPAPLRRVAVGLCPAVPGDDAEAGRRPDRRPVAGHLHRAEDHLEEPALHGRHRHRDLRLHAAALGAHRRALFAGHRPADREPDRVADGRPRAGAARRHPHLRAGARRARPQGRVPQGARRVPQEGLPARQDRRRVPRDRRGQAARQEVHPRHRRGGRPPGGAPRHRARGSRTRWSNASSSPRAWRWSSSPTASSSAPRPTPGGTRTPSASSSRKSSPARCPASPSPRSSRGCSRSTIRSAPARNAAASASSSTSTRTW